MKYLKHSGRQPASQALLPAWCLRAPDWGWWRIHSDILHELRKKNAKMQNARSRNPVGRFGRPDMFLMSTDRERSIPHGFARLFRRYSTLKPPRVKVLPFSTPKPVIFWYKKRSTTRGELEGLNSVSVQGAPLWDGSLFAPKYDRFGSWKWLYLYSLRFQSTISAK